MAYDILNAIVEIESFSTMSQRNLQNKRFADFGDLFERRALRSSWGIIARKARKGAKAERQRYWGSTQIFFMIKNQPYQITR